MNRKNLPTSTKALERVRRQFETWRGKRKKRCPIPEPLWKAAAKLCQDLSVNKVARTLQLNYYALKKRVLPEVSTQKPAEDIRPSFVQFHMPPPMVSPEWIVEMENPQGAKMKIHCKGQDGAALVACLFRDFCSQ